ncbi:winged helix-turn-helix transcriptional regulator [Phormidium tenue FACHB-886]|nr:winged helix-turn-helix transcriptional regulator [Phormidium tenue FACHB-886]
MTERTSNLLGALALAVTDRMHAAARETIKHAGETPAALVLIGLEPGMSNDRLRRILGMSHPGTVRLVDRLVSDGLVERRPSGRDGREIALYLTPEGQQCRSTLLNNRMAVVHPLLEVLDNSEQTVLSNLLHKMLTAIPNSEIEMYTICRMCDESVCENCPLPGKCD